MASPPSPAPALTPIAASTPSTTNPPSSRHEADLDDILARLGEEDWELDEGPAAHDSPSRSTASPSSGSSAGSTSPPSTPRGPAVGARLTDPRDLARPSSASGIVVEVGSGVGFDPTFATFGQRALGAIVDTIVVTLAVLPGFLLLRLTDGAGLALLALLLMVGGFTAVVVLAARSIATSGKWIGNRVTGTTVVDGINGSFVDPGRAGLRMIGRHVLSPFLLLGYLVALPDGQRRTFHDRLAGTVVIRRSREVWNADDS
ncbi:MAG: RDD family protein [Ilumatobacter sp.]|uniref:RDD family protein n=2 Tax=Ilumatobacter sp. TaxID=1967498 RepID=UPI003298FD54